MKDAICTIVHCLDVAMGMGRMAKSQESAGSEQAAARHACFC